MKIERISNVSGATKKSESRVSVNSSPAKIIKNGGKKLTIALAGLATLGMTNAPAKANSNRCIEPTTPERVIIESSYEEPRRVCYPRYENSTIPVEPAEYITEPEVSSIPVECITCEPEDVSTIPVMPECAEPVEPQQIEQNIPVANNPFNELTQDEVYEMMHKKEQEAYKKRIAENPYNGLTEDEILEKLHGLGKNRPENPFHELTQDEVHEMMLLQEMLEEIRKKAQPTEPQKTNLTEPVENTSTIPVIPECTEPTLP